MAATQSVRFNCPNCDAQYKLIRIEADSVTADRQIECLTCGTPLQGREGRYVLKYFLLDASHRASKRRVAKSRAA
jgi:DNA-directed RNA polymerase subunit RPC12/RpoP